MSAVKKAMFKSAYNFTCENDRSEGKSTPVGGPMDPIYEYQIDDYGRKILVQTGETNRWEKIQEAEEDTKLSVILAKCANGDMSSLRPGGQYMDCTAMPKDLLEARQMMQNLENVWKDLDKEIREKYNYDLNQFIAQAGSDEWLKDMGLIEKEIIEDIKETASPINDTTKGEAKDE